MERMLSDRMYVQAKPSYKLNLVCFIIRKVYNQIISFYDKLTWKKLTISII